MSVALSNWRMRNFVEGQQGRAPWWLSAEALEHWVEGFNHRLEYLGVPVRLRVESHPENPTPAASATSRAVERGGLHA